jgi:aryl-phospho-beta-D-glucosidase BglC (GH1 family)
VALPIHMRGAAPGVGKGRGLAAAQSGNRSAVAPAPYAIDPAFMARVKHIVEKARAAHLRIILNDHNYDALMSDPMGNRERLAGIWRQIALAFADVPRDQLWFEIENEPYDTLTNANLLATLTPALAAIRESNPNRIVVMGANFGAVSIHSPHSRCPMTLI